MSFVLQQITSTFCFLGLLNNLSQVLLKDLLLIMVGKVTESCNLNLNAGIVDYNAIYLSNNDKNFFFLQK